MKTLILTLTSLLSMSILNAQQDDLFAYASPSEPTAVSNGIMTKESVAANAMYLNTVKTSEYSQRISAIQKEVASYDIRTLDIYDTSEKSTYDVVFKRGQSTVIVQYDNNGTVLSTKEFYKDIRLPAGLAVSIAKSYPGWSVTATTLELKYSNQSETLAIYTVSLQLGTEKQKITVRQ